MGAAELAERESVGAAILPSRATPEHCIGCVAKLWLALALDESKHTTWTVEARRGARTSTSRVLTHNPLLKNKGFLIQHRKGMFYIYRDLYE